MFQSYVSFNVKITSMYNRRTATVSSSVVLKVFLFTGCLLLLSHVTSTPIASGSGAHQPDSRLGILAFAVSHD